MGVRPGHRHRLHFVARLIACLWLGAGLVVASGCGSAMRWADDTHVVAEGETLYAIAWRYGLDPTRLAAWNQLGDGSLIYPGQRLRLSPPAGGAASAGSARPPAAPRPAAPPPRREQAVAGWRWPTEGPLVERFGASPKTESGIQIGGRRGQPVAAAAPGEVVYAGSGLKVYGQLVIIRHNASFLSAYGYNEALLVREGERVNAGQAIARMGEGPGRQPLLHFEIRRNGQPVDPLAYIGSP